MVGTPSATCTEHHDLSPAVWTRKEVNIARLKSVVRSSIYHMKYEGEDLNNIMTKVVMPAEMLTDVCNQDEMGQQEYAKFVEEHINTNEVSVWVRMKNEQLKRVSEAQSDLFDQIVELKEEWSLFACILIVARSSLRST